MTLIDFLLARIAEDERDASEADEGRLWRWSQHDNMIINDAGHMQRFTPTRMMAECEAKRRLIDWGAPVSGSKRVPTDRPGVYDRRDVRYINEDGEDVLRYLALPYADHEDYDESWRP